MQPAKPEERPEGDAFCTRNVDYIEDPNTKQVVAKTNGIAVATYVKPGTFNTVWENDTSRAPTVAHAFARTAPHTWLATTMTTAQPLLASEVRVGRVSESPESGRSAMFSAEHSKMS